MLTVINAFDAKAYGNCQKDLVFQNELLYIKETSVNTTDEVQLFIVAANKHQAALDLCHHDTRHQGHNRTFSLLKERFWWPKMMMMTSVMNCAKCKVFERRKPKAPVCSIVASEPMDLTQVSIPDKCAVTIAKCLYDKYFRHGFPRRLMSDQGKEFCNDIVTNISLYY